MKKRKALQIPLTVSTGKFAKIAAAVKLLYSFTQESEAILHQIEPVSETSPHFNIFNQVIDEDKLADCFKQIYAHYCGEARSKALEGRWDKVTIACHLFMLVDRFKLGKDDFAINSKQPFFEFIQTKVIDTGMTSRTFHNRFQKMSDVHKKIMQKPRGKELNRALQGNVHYRNFHQVLTIFYGLQFYRELEKLQKG